MGMDLVSLWLPILLSTVGVFIVSSLIWTVIQWHNSDWKQLPDEEAARAALKGVPAGQYTVPWACDNKAKQDEAWLEKAKEGPMGMITIFGEGHPTAMGKPLTQWFIYLLVANIIIAMVSNVTINAGASFIIVFHSVAIYAAMFYCGAHAMNGIWFGHSWGRVIKDIVDGLIYALLTGAIFAWLWPSTS